MARRQSDGLLRESAGFRALWLSRLISFAGDGITFAALTLLAASQGGARSVSLVLLVFALPRLAGPFAGVFADRSDVRLLMGGCELGQAVLIGLLAVIEPGLPAILLLFGAAQVLSTIRAPAGRSVVPSLVEAEDIGRANALLSLGFPMQAVVGPALAGLLVAGPGGVKTALLVDAATFTISAVFLLQMPKIAPGSSAKTRMWVDFLAGLRHVTSDRMLRRLLLGLFVAGAFGALDNVALVFLVQRDLHSGALAYGLCLAAAGVGAAAAVALLARFLRPADALPGLLIGTGLFGFGLVGTGLAPAFVIALLAQLLAGGGYLTQSATVDTIVQTAVPDDVLGRTFGIFGTVSQLAAALAYLVGGPLLRATSPRAVFVVAGVGVVAALAFLIPAARSGGSES